jgi:acyl-CoA synthetase (AMP-forming)/AMP-acid ligase II
MQRHLPPPARFIALPRPAIRDIEDYDRKLTAIAEAYLDYDIRGITGTTCWFSILFDRVLTAARSQGRSINTISQIWPNLRVLFGGGVYAEPYRQIIDERIGKPIVLIDNYNATEGGLFSVTDRLDDSGMLMIPDRGVFYEFVPRAQHGRPDAERVPLWEVEPGVDYSVVLTTSSGLFGYYIGDLVRFVSIFPHRMEFAGRTSGMLSVTQELTSYLEIERAVTAAVREQTCSVVDFTASSEVGVDGTAKGRYILFAEFDRAPADLASFASIVDRELCAQNRVYREHRTKDVAILPPVVVPLARGTTRSFMEALGQTSVQSKFPRIIDERRRDILRSIARTNGVEGRGAP